MSSIGMIFAIGQWSIAYSLSPCSSRPTNSTYFVHRDPNAGPTSKPNHLPAWIPFDSTNMGTYEISAAMEMRYNVFARTIAIWNEAVPHLIENAICEMPEEVG